MARQDKLSASHRRGSTSSSLSSSSAAAAAVAAAASTAAAAAAKRTVEWVMTSDVPTDVAVEVAGTSFALHKFPLVSRSGRIRKLVVETRDLDPSQIRLPDIPGGAEVFEVVAKFCYGINFEITSSNVAVLRCAAHYLEMTEEYGEVNLVGRTEAFLNEVAVQDFSIAVSVLHNCENLVPMSEELKIVSRCIDAIATMATASIGKEQGAASSLELNSTNGWQENPVQTHKADHWWADDLAILRIDFYQRVLAAMMSRGLQHDSIGGALMTYAQRYLKGLNMRPMLGQQREHLTSSKSSKNYQGETNGAVEQEQRALVETLVSMLPCEKNAISCSFLFGLLRSAIILDASVNCRVEVEQRIGMQLEQATLDDLLIPSFNYTNETLFDVDVVHRLVVNFVQHKEKEDSQAAGYESDGTSPPGRDRTGCQPQAAEVLCTGGAHSGLCSGGERRPVQVHRHLPEGKPKFLQFLLGLPRNVCMNRLTRLSPKPRGRRSVQVVVQVLYFEQVRLRAAMAASMLDGDHLGHFHHKLGSGALSAAISPRDHYASIRRENRELKLEVARMRMRLTELEKDHVCMKQVMEKSSASAAHNFLHSLSRRLISRLNPFGAKHSHAQPPQTPDSRLSSRRRRHSIS